MYHFKPFTKITNEIIYKVHKFLANRNLVCHGCEGPCFKKAKDVVDQHYMKMMILIMCSNAMNALQLNKNIGKKLGKNTITVDGKIINGHYKRTLRL